MEKHQSFVYSTGWRQVMFLFKLDRGQRGLIFLLRYQNKAGEYLYISSGLSPLDDRFIQQDGLVESYQ